jgi:hypothetical protein
MGLQKKILYVIIMLVIVGIVLYSFSLINKNSIVELEKVPFSYNDSFQLRTAHIMVFEYVGINNLYPLQYYELGKKEYVSDRIDCFDYYGNLYDSISLNENVCINPIYWRYLYYEYSFSNVTLGFRVFETTEDAEQYFNSAVQELEEAFIESNINGERIQSRVQIVPYEIGKEIDEIEFFTISDNDGIYYLITIIKSDNTIYTIFEKSNNTIGGRMFTASFSPEMHESYIKSRRLILPE